MLKEKPPLHNQIQGRLLFPVSGIPPKSEPHLRAPEFARTGGSAMQCGM